MTKCVLFPTIYCIDFCGANMAASEKPALSGLNCTDLLQAALDCVRLPPDGNIVLNVQFIS